MPVVAPGKDEVDRFVAALFELELPENVVASYKVSFEISSEEIRQQLWEAIESQQVQQQNPEQVQVPVSSGSVDAEVGTLKTGDYALAGDSHFGIELKNFNEFSSTTTNR